MEPPTLPIEIWFMIVEPILLSYLQQNLPICINATGCPCCQRLPQVHQILSLLKLTLLPNGLTRGMIGALLLKHARFTFHLVVSKSAVLSSTWVLNSRFFALIRNLPFNLELIIQPAVGEEFGDVVPVADIGGFAAFAGLFLGSDPYLSRRMSITSRTYQSKRYDRISKQIYARIHVILDQALPILQRKYGPTIDALQPFRNPTRPEVTTMFHNLTSTLDTVFQNVHSPPLPTLPDDDWEELCLEKYREEQQREEEEGLAACLYYTHSGGYLSSPPPEYSFDPMLTLDDLYVIPESQLCSDGLKDVLRSLAAEEQDQMDIIAENGEPDMFPSSPPSLPSSYYLDNEHDEYDIRFLERLDGDGPTESAIRSEGMAQVQEQIRLEDDEKMDCMNGVS